MVLGNGIFVSVTVVTFLVFPTIVVVDVTVVVEFGYIWSFGRACRIRASSALVKSCNVRVRNSEYAMILSVICVRFCATDFAQSYGVVAISSSNFMIRCCLLCALLRLFVLFVVFCGGCGVEGSVVREGSCWRLGVSLVVLCDGHRGENSMFREGSCWGFGVVSICDGHRGEKCMFREGSC